MRISELARELKPYMIAAAREVGVVGGTSGGGAGGALTSHVLATNVALGDYHTVSGLTAGHVLKATAANAAAFGQLSHTSLADLTSGDPHTQYLLESNAAGAGLVFSGAFLGVGAGAGLTVGADAVALDTPGTLDVSSTNVATGNHTHAITASADVSAGTTALLKSSSGALGLLSVTSGTTITMAPTSAQVLPTGSILKDLGDYNRKWRTLYAAELYVETLVAQDVLATIGGRIIVAPTTTLTADCNIGATTVTVEHNNLDGAFLYLSSAPGGVAQVEVMKVTAGPTGTGPYTYTVDRAEDGSPQNNWVAGDAVVNLGAAAGQGWIDLTSTSTVYSHLGPTVTVYARTAMTNWTDAKPVTTMGNLRSFLGYGADEYGFALGNDLTLTATTGFIGLTAERTNGLRLFNTDLQMYTGGALYFEIEPTSGPDMVVTTSWANQRSYSFSSGGTTIGGMYGLSDTGTQIGIRALQTGTKNAFVYVQAEGTDTYPGRTYLSAGKTAGPVVQLDLDAGAGTLAVSATASTFTGTLAATGSITVDGATPTLYVGDSTVSTSGASIKVGYGRTGSGFAFLDLVGDTTYTDYGLRIIRGSSGANANSEITHRGTGALTLNTADAAPIYAYTNGTLRLSILSDGKVGVGNITPTSLLHVDGNIKANVGVIVAGDAGNQGAGTVTFTNASSSVSTGTGTVKLAGTTARNSDVLLKVYIGTTQYYIPAWSDIS